MEFRLLGPIEVQEGGLPVDLGPPQRRVVLAALAVDAGRPVTLETLIDRVWDETPPEDPRAALYVHVTAIRKALRSAGGDRPVRLPRQGGGYVLEVDPDSVDVHRFRRLTATAGDAQRSDRERATLLSEALGLWRGTPLDGVSGDWAARMRTGWTGLRLDAAVAWAETGLRLGLAAEVIGPVRELLAAYPLAESLVAVLMRGLAGTGRHAEALSCYAAARTRLAEELGMEPGPQLRTVHQTVLRGELDRSAPDRSVQSAAGPVRPVPEQLPAGVPDFVARERELSELDRLAGGWQGGPGATPGAGQPSTAVTILAISGTAGVGKTALAVRWAHRVRGLFPDGQLYVNLRGYDPDQPVAPTDALARFLRALGVSGQDIPLDLDQRTVAYRTLLDRQRTLVVLDNAASVEQVRPLLPGSSSCAVVVTSRDSLAGLVALHGARRLDLDLLPPADAVDLLRRLIGARVLAESDAAAALADQCARLPLALRVAAELAAARPSASLSELVTELADQQDRLDLLDAGGDPRAAVQAVFSWSCQQLPADAAGAFRLLGLHPGADLDTRAAAALIATTVADARRLLDGLLRAHLVYSTGPARYGMHDLLRGYALRLTSTEDPDGVRQAALTRLYDHYLATATGAVNVRFGTGGPGRQHAAGAASVPAFPDPAAALAWLDAERATIVAVCGRVAGHGRPDHAIRLAAILFRYLHVGGHFPEALTVQAHARRAARLIGDPAEEAHALSNLGLIHLRQGRYREAGEHYEQALVLFRETGHRAGEGRALSSAGLLHWRQGRYREATEHYDRALALFRETGQRAGEAHTLSNLGLVHWRQGRYDAAVAHHERALALYRAGGPRFGEGNALANLGAVRLRMGCYEQAEDDLQRALAIFLETGNRLGEAYALAHLGLIRGRLGRHARAVDLLRRALAIFRETGDRDGEAQALNDLGEVLYLAGDSVHSRSEHGAALAVAAATGERYQQGRAHLGLGRALHAAGRRDEARQHWLAALTRYADLGVPEAGEVRSELAALERRADDDG